ncbi:hypothetical protein V8G54_031456 [Vigna mungo]|uniref:Uncharacterized protein n=1 Tax=Vigna mungo TaxID=3915 RepID=A0AAQ3RGX4_VIGMU
MRVKYSPLPCARPDMMELLKPEPDLPAWLLLRAASVSRDSTLLASRLSLRWKSCSGVLSEESASMWCRLRERASSGSGSARASASGHERVGGWGREWRVKVWVWSWNGRVAAAERERARARDRKRRPFVVFFFPSMVAVCE